VLVVGAAAVLAAVVLALAAFGRHEINGSRARTAADAAALAGVEGGRSGAERLAAENGGELVSFEAHGHEVWVTVSVDGVSASARADDGG
jgi:hypothetical protein